MELHPLYRTLSPAFILQSRKVLTAPDIFWCNSVWEIHFQELFCLEAMAFSELFNNLNREDIVFIISIIYCILLK